MRIVFMGTPEFAVPTLAAIAGAGHEVAAVYTRAPRPAGRGMAERPSAVHRFAADAGLPVLTPTSLKGEAEQRAFAAHRADVAVVVAYGLILPRAILAAPREGCLNLHASLLPRWRGAAPIQRTLMAGDTETAATVMRMDEGLDTGPVCLVRRVPIGPDTTAGELHDALAAQGAALMVEALAALERSQLQCVAQPAEGVTYAAKIGKDETRIDFARASRAVHDHVRALSPAPGAWTEAAPTGGRPERLKVLRTALVEGSGPPGTVLPGGLTVGCGQGAVRILEVQRGGKRPMPAEEFLRGFPLQPGHPLAGPSR
jgi:methionyl-tRNA formyltransferase